MVLWSVSLLPPVQQAPTPPATGSDTAALLGWLVGVVLAAGIVFVVAMPLLDQSKRRKLTQETHRREKNHLEGLQETAQAERRILEDLEFDRELGIMEDRDYADLKEKSESRLETLREEIEQLQHKLAGGTAPLYKANGTASRTASRAKVAVSGGETRTAGATATKSKTGETGKFYFKAAIKEKLKCSECGTPFKPGDRFCRQCSAPLPLLCLNCGKEVTEDDRFCAGCGSAVNT